MKYFGRITVAILAVIAASGSSSLAQEPPGAVEFQKKIHPLLEEYCFDCHADGANKGGLALDEFPSNTALLENHELWWKVLKNLRANIMPPPKKDQPTAEEKEIIGHWIKRSVFAANPNNPDPGRVTVRRLNRVEYRNTIRDLIGVDFDTQAEFPPDDTGHGFDNMGDVLTLPPMLLEKYLLAASKIVEETVPTAPRVAREQWIGGRRFSGGETSPGRGGRGDGPSSLSFYKAASVSNIFSADVAGKYQLAVNLVINERYVDDVFDYNKCRVVFRVDGKELLRQEYSWEGGKPFNYTFDQQWQAGDHVMEFEIEPLTPDAKQTRTLSVQISGVNVRGPMAEQYWVTAKDYGRFFPKPAPADAQDRRTYAKELLGGFARRAYRRPVDDETINRLADLAQSVYSQPGKTFEAGVVQGMVAILASPRFLFREESVAEMPDGKAFAFVDEYALASRLSYFLWSSMPDEELFQLAGRGELRKNLSPQVARMMADKRSAALVENFAGQWLQTRDIESVPIEARPVLAREEKFDPEADLQRKRFRALNDKSDEELTPQEKEELQNIRQRFRGARKPLRAEMNGDIRRAMRQETEQTFDLVVREDRSVLELLDSDYTFLNERLANHYGLTNLNITGDEMRLVKLPADSPRGGILTQGTFLGVTSNPTRTSPVKRGVFILDNILGTPPSPPPPDVPALEAATADVTNRVPSLRESLAIHRQNALCSSCHNRMDPLGLALENFNAMGMWRDREFDEPIDASGNFAGEEFTSVKDLKLSLVKNHYKEFYRTVTEKLLTYALGRGVEYSDVETVDQIVERLEKAGGRPSALLSGIVESAPFQKTRGSDVPVKKAATGNVQQQAATTTKP